MEEIRTHLHQAIDSFYRLYPKDNNSGFKYTKAEKLIVRSCSEILTFGSVFLLDDAISELMKSTKGEKNYFDLPARLPYPIIALEHSVECPLNAEETQWEKATQISIFRELPCPVKGIMDEDKEMIYLEPYCLNAFCFFRAKAATNNEWVFQPTSYDIVFNSANGKSGTLSPTDDNFFCDAELIAQMGQQEAIRSHSIESGLMANALFHFLNVMNCNNVKTKLHNPPKELLKKRKLAGKTPLFSYHTLHIGEDTETLDGSVPNGYSDRNSPRIHYRRGHVRRLQSGQKTWVSQCIVGKANTGEIGKEYHVSSTMAASKRSD